MTIFYVRSGDPNDHFLCLSVQRYMLKVPTYESDAKATWPGAETVFMVVNSVVNVLFIVELLVRLLEWGQSRD